MRHCLALLFFSLLTHGCVPQPESPGPEGHAAPMHLFLLAGQSNMAGRGIVDEESLSAHPRVIMLSREEAWVPALDPLHFDKPIAGVGPGKAFGEAIAEHDETIQVGLIPTAVGGSPISTWQPGAYYEATKSFPYDDALRRARKAMEAGTIKAVLWHQGESDSKEALAPQYKAHLVQLIHRFRAEFEQPDLPFIIGQLGQFEGKPWDEWRTEVDNAHREIAAEVSSVAFVSSDGLGHKGDSVHFSTAAARTLGARYARAYTEMVK